MKIIISPDSFKGSCSSLRAAEVIADAIRSLDENAELIKIPIADGGEGTVEAVYCSKKAAVQQVQVSGPTGKPVWAKYAILDDGNTAVIEMAQASGLTLIPKEEQNPMVTTSYGTGQMIKDALDQGCRKLVIGIGGSATNDGGVGALMALGAIFQKEDGTSVALGGRGLSELRKLDLSQLDPRLSRAEILVACDVNNPLTGPNGATFVYGPQKGANPAMVEELDEAMKNLARVSAAYLEQDCSEFPGAGAAGGMGFALQAFCKARFVAGIDMILDVTGFEKELQDADLVITGEGRIDGQSVYGKVLYGIGMRGKKYGVPVIAFGGAVTEDSEELLEYGITAMFAIENKPMSLEYAMEHVEELLKMKVKNVLRVWGLRKKG